MAHARERIGSSTLLTMAALVVVIAGLRAAAPVILPMLVAAFLAVLAIPPIQWLHRRRLPVWLATAIVFVAVLGLLVGVTAIVGASISMFTDNIPDYEAALRVRFAGIFTWFEQRQIQLNDDSMREGLDPGQAMELFGSALTAARKILSNLLFVTLLVAFTLAEAAGLPRKLRMALGDPQADLARFGRVLSDLNHYLWIKTQTSLMTGVAAGLFVWACGVDYPLLWGMLAYLLNYIPQLGSFIAAIPACLMTLIQFGWNWALIVTAWYVFINVMIGSILEPRWMGHSLGLSTLVVFLSLVFWGWVWGPVGMFLCVPLTMIVKILLEHSDDLQWVAILLGSGREARARADAAESGVYPTHLPPPPVRRTGSHRTLPSE